MKHVKLFEAFVNEKVYRMSKPYSATGIIGKVMQAFKKEIEAISYDGDVDATLLEINKEWKEFQNTASSIIMPFIEKKVKSIDDVTSVTVNLEREWVLDEVNKLNADIETRDNIYIVLNGADTVINIGFMDDVNANKSARKLGGMANSPVKTVGDVDIHGTFDINVGENNIEIRDNEIMNIEA